MTEARCYRHLSGWPRFDSCSMSRRTGYVADKPLLIEIICGISGSSRARSARVHLVPPVIFSCFRTSPMKESTRAASSASTASWPPSTWLRVLRRPRTRTRRPSPPSSRMVTRAAEQGAGAVCRTHPDDLPLVWRWNMSFRNGLTQPLLLRFSL